MSGPRRLDPHDFAPADLFERLGPVGKPTMVMRSVRVPLVLWTAARAKADEREENISDVIREALQRYVNRR